MTDVIISTIAGTVLGVIFALIKQPLPAPIAFAGVMAIFGLWAGYTTVTILR